MRAHSPKVCGGSAATIVGKLVRLSQKLGARPAAKDASLKDFLACKNLTYLVMAGTKITDTGLKELATDGGEVSNPDGV